MKFSLKLNPDISFPTKMTLWVASAVTLVAGGILLVAANMLRDKFEEETKERLEEAIDWTTKIVKQRMLRVECATRTAAAIASDYTDNASDQQIDSMLYRTISGMECIDVSSLILKNDKGEAITHYAYRDKSHPKTIRNGKKFAWKNYVDDSNWIDSYYRGKTVWSDFYAIRELSHSKLICCSVPVYSAKGERRGMFCSDIKIEWITEIILKYKVNNDFDVAVYAEKECIVPSSKQIQELNKEDIVQEERTIDDMNWRLVFSVDKHEITKKTQRALMVMTGIIAILLITMIIVITLTIKFVARPFVRKQRHTAEIKAAMQRELDIAAKTQQEFVPHSFPPFPDHKEIDLHACLRPARKVGGDLYDYFIKDDTLYFCIGDVSGKGVPASLFMAATHYLFRSVASSLDIEQAVQQINQSLCSDNAQCTFVTFWFGILDLHTFTLNYINAGHNSPVIVHEGKTEFMPQAENMPLGIGEEEEYKAQSITLSHGDTLLLYTDGVTESMNIKSEQFGDNRLLDEVKDMSSLSSTDIIANLLEKIKQHATGREQSDDITMLSLKI